MMTQEDVAIRERVMATWSDETRRANWVTERNAQFYLEDLFRYGPNTIANCIKQAIKEELSMVERTEPTPRTRAEFLTKWVNFDEWDTGGGCKALGLDLDGDGTHGRKVQILITDDMRIPSDDSMEISVGIYVITDEGEFLGDDNSDCAVKSSDGLSWEGVDLFLETYLDDITTEWLK